MTAEALTLPMGQGGTDSAAAPGPGVEAASRDLSAGLAGLAALSMEHADSVAGAVDASGLSCWVAYFPHLLCISRSARRILYESFDGALLLYLLRSDRGQPELSLLFPPLPFDPAALSHAGERMEAVNHDRRQSIEWIGENMALDVARAGYSIRIRASEFVLDQGAVAAAEGPSFSRLRQKGLARASRLPGLAMRPYSSADLEPCIDLLRGWRARLEEKNIVPNGYRYTRRCLERASDFPREMLRGEVAEVDGRIGGFAFGGPINRSWGSLFIAITDLAFAGLPYLLRHRMIAAFPELRFFNSSTDNGRSGPEELKRSFRPIGLAVSYRGRAR
jgi:hypothetical protein